MKKILCLILIFATPIVTFAQSNITCVNLNANLRYGFKDSPGVQNIYKLQQFLNSVGYNIGTPIGIFGPKTRAAVTDFQAANNLPPIGVVGPLTRAMIKEISCKQDTVIKTEDPVVSVETVNPNNVSNNTITTETVNPVNQTQAPIEDTVLVESNVSSLKVRTDGIVSIGTKSITIAGTITSGTNANTQRWFEITKNPSIYKLSETTITNRVYERGNRKFEEIVSGLESNTTYYFRACAGNNDLSQRTCGGTTMVKTAN